jgi:hypothetical protein
MWALYGGGIMSELNKLTHSSRKLPWVNKETIKKIKNQEIFRNKKGKSESNANELPSPPALIPQAKTPLGNKYLQMLLGSTPQEGQKGNDDAKNSKHEDKKRVPKSLTTLMNEPENESNMQINSTKKADLAENSIEKHDQNKDLKSDKNVSTSVKSPPANSSNNNNSNDVTTHNYVPPFTEDPYYLTRNAKKGAYCPISQEDEKKHDLSREFADTHNSYSKYKYQETNNFKEAQIMSRNDNCRDDLSPLQDDCGVVRSRTEQEVDNFDNLYYPNIIKVPRVLAEPEVQVCVEADIELEANALEIKRVLKDVFLTQCKLIPTKFVRGTKFVKLGKLYIAGFIRKNIEYATVGEQGDNAFCGDIRHTTVNVPFSLCTEIFFPPGRQPIYSVTEQQSFEFLNDEGTGPKLNKKLFRNHVDYNEQPFCELVRAKFHELDFVPDSIPPVNGNGNGFERPFRTFREKIVLELTVKVLQVQQLHVKLQDPCRSNDFDSSDSSSSSSSSSNDCY